MSKYLLTQNLEDKKVLELGAGTALPSIICGIKGAEVYTTDIFPALDLTIKNINLNEHLCSKKITPLELDWTNQEQRNNIPNISFDFILLSDIFYLPV